MADRTIRIGKVSSVDYGSGMIKVTYPDLDNSVTDDLPYLTFNDEYKMPKVGASVLVVHLSNGSAMGIVAGTYWNSSHRPPVSGKGVYRKDLAQAIGEAFLQLLEKFIFIEIQSRQFGVFLYVVNIRNGFPGVEIVLLHCGAGLIRQALVAFFRRAAHAADYDCDQ